MSDRRGGVLPRLVKVAWWDRVDMRPPLGRVCPSLLARACLQLGEPLAYNVILKVGHHKEIL